MNNVKVKNPKERPAADLPAGTIAHVCGVDSIIVTTNSDSPACSLLNGFLYMADPHLEVIPISADEEVKITPET